MISSLTLLSGSDRKHPAGTVSAGTPPPDQIIKITILLRRKTAASHDAPGALYSHDELAAAYGADPGDIEAVENFASDHNFSISGVDPGARSVIISGSLSELAAAFGADLDLRHVGSEIFRTRQGHLHVPDSLAGRVVAVLGFDERPVAATYHRVVRHDASAAQQQQTPTYTPRDLAQIYNFPKTTGKNQTIAIIELGGGFRSADLHKYWQSLGLKNVQTTAVGVGGARNKPPHEPNGPDGEVVLDIEVAGGVAPEAKLAVYFAPNTDQGFLSAISEAIHDRVRKPSAISISWGAPETAWTGQSLDAFNSAFHDAAMLGISVCCAAGDNGSSDGVNDGMTHCDFPASSPWVLACGGTRLIADNHRIQSETVWNDGQQSGATGGGISAHFALPSYQQNLSAPIGGGSTALQFRGVPDIAAVADPETGYQVFVDGTSAVIGGTSAVAPLWAGLIACLNEALGRNAGFLHPALYTTVKNAHAFNDVVSGTNDYFKASQGWDACTGLGSPNGQAILDVLKQQQ